MSWTDRARDLEDPKAAGAKGADDVRARALFAIALTYGIPSPPDDTGHGLRGPFFGAICRDRVVDPAGAATSRVNRKTEKPLPPLGF